MTKFYRCVRQSNILKLICYIFETYFLICCSGLPGKYIDQGIAKPIIENMFTPVSMFTQVSLQDMADKEKGQQHNTKKGELFISNRFFTMNNYFIFFHLIE